MRQRGIVLSLVGLVWCLGMATAAVPGVSWCGGSLVSDLCRSLIPLAVTLGLASYAMSRSADRKTSPRQGSHSVRCSGAGEGVHDGSPDSSNRPDGGIGRGAPSWVGGEPRPSTADVSTCAAVGRIRY